MTYNVDALRQAQTPEALTATGFAKLCEHGHWMHTPNNSPLPAHTADYHNPDRNGIGGHYPDPNGSWNQSDLRFDQFHEKDLTGRGYSPDVIMGHLLTTNGNVSMCPHGAVANNTHGACSTGEHTPPFMRGVERNMNSYETDEALGDRLSDWRGHHTWNDTRDDDEEDDDDGWSENSTPRTEQALVDEEPARADRIRQNISKVVSLANSPRVKQSDYTARSFPSGTFYEDRIDDKSPEQAERDGRTWSSHTVIGYHKGVAVGRLTYSSDGYVGGWYIDHNHQKGPVSIQMLATAHQHLLELGNPLGMLKSDNTTSNSAAVIRKVDPESTWLRQPGANSGWERGSEWSAEHNDYGIHPYLPEHTERRSRREWAHLSEFTGLNIHELHAISPDERVRNLAELDQVGNAEAEDIYHSYRKQKETSEKLKETSKKISERDSIPERISRFSLPGGFLGDTANLETQKSDSEVPEYLPHWREQRRNRLDALEELNNYDLATLRQGTARRISNNREKSSERALKLQMDSIRRSGGNPEEKLSEQVSSGATGVWTGEEETPMEKDPAERARALMATPRYKREF